MIVLSPPLQIAALCYMFTATILVFVLGCYIYFLQRNRKRCTCSLAEKDVEMRKAHRKSENNVYEADRSTKAEHSSSLHQVRMSEYVSITSDSQKRSSPPLPTNDRTVVEIDDSAYFLNAYETIVDSLYISLCKVPKSKQDLYARFLNDLAKKIKMKDSAVYDKLQMCGLLNVNHYEVINENEPGSEYDSDDCTYVKYVPSESVKQSLMRAQALHRTQCPKHVYGPNERLRNCLKEQKDAKNMSRSEKPPIPPKKVRLRKNSEEDVI
ncbi:uncharacterized protein LOC103312755 [Tribolium castaneum]|uniref:uncharacterized protein LOC103312755 n=1 Tax=Tribolium castaneum TaxID=7070 RepID=UPI0030FEF683